MVGRPLKEGASSQLPRDQGTVVSRKRDHEDKEGGGQLPNMGGGSGGERVGRQVFQER